MSSACGVPEWDPVSSVQESGWVVCVWSIPAVSSLQLSLVRSVTRRESCDDYETLLSESAIHIDTQHAVG